MQNSLTFIRDPCICRGIALTERTAFLGQLQPCRCTMRRVFSVIHRRMDATNIRGYPLRFIPPRHERVGFDSVTDKNKKVTIQ